MTSLRDAMIVRRLRNSCARFMTQAREPIGRLAQARWFLRRYRAAARAGRYRVYLFFDGRAPVGYGALQRYEDVLLVTECVADEHRGHGAGKEILAALVDVARREQRDLVAEIWASNAPSLALHERAGFVLEASTERDGESLRRYRLRTGEA